MLILSLIISMSALAFEVSFDGSREEAEVTPANTTNVVIYNPSVTGTWIPEVTSPSVSLNPDVTGGVIVTMPSEPIFTTQLPGGDKPGFQSNVYVSGSDSVYSGNTFGFSVMVDTPISVKSGAISLEYDHEIFTLEYVGWYLSSNPVITHFDEEQENGVFAYAEPTDIQGEIFYVSLYVNEGAPFTETSIYFDLTLKDANHNDIFVIDPQKTVHVGCEYHSMSQFVSESTLAHPATCLSPAEYFFSCDVCGYLYDSTFFDGAPSDHSDRGVWHADEETHWHGCDYCHDIDYDMGKHTFGKWVTIKEATKEEDGVRECSCSVCGYTVAENVKYNKGSSSGGSTEEETDAPVTTAAAQNVTVTVGCGSSIALSTLAILPALAVGALVVKKKED